MRQQAGCGAVLEHGAHILPNTNAHQLGEALEPLLRGILAADLWVTVTSDIVIRLSSIVGKAIWRQRDDSAGG